MPTEVDDFTQKLLERTMARREAMQQKMIEHSMPQARKRRPLEAQDNIETTNNDEVSMEVDNQGGGKLGTSQSPNKRSRMDDKHNENNPSSKTTGESSKVSDRMKRILNQRKQWEAADQGLDVDFTNVPSPVRNETGGFPDTDTKRQVDSGRRARLAALAEKVSNYEDDYSHHMCQPSPEKEKKVWKPGVGRKTPMSEAYQSAVLQPVQPTKEAAEVKEEKKVKQISNRVSLSIETLAQFATNTRDVKRVETPTKTNAPTKFSSNKITLSHANNAESPAMTSSHQVTPTTKSLQQRMIELQKNGCKAETSGVDKLMEERQRELDLLRGEDGTDVGQDETEVGQVGTGVGQDETEVGQVGTGVGQDETEVGQVGTGVGQGGLAEEQDSSDVEGVEEKDVVDAPYEDEEDEDSDEEGEGCMLEDEDLDEVETDLCETTTEDSLYMGGDSPVPGTQDDKALEVGGVESMKRNDHMTSEVIDTSVDETPATPDDVGDSMIDDLFEGVDYEEGPRTPSPFAPTLTRQKSKLEIKCELSVRKQTCNEAEDTHPVLRQPSRRFRPLARSTSSESVVSLGGEKKEDKFPVFTIDSYRTEKRKSIRKQTENKKVVRNESVQSVAPQKARTVKEKISSLMDEIQHQQRVIQQASAALNCCYDTNHGKGSITELEAEKVLLIASEKRLALLAEVQRLKSEAVTGSPDTTQPCQGNLIIKNLRLPLRTEYIFSMASKKDSGDIRSHYYFLLIRCGPTRILATHLASTHDSLSGDSLVFKDSFKLEELESDFDITIEVYSVTHRSRADGVPNQEKSKRKLSGILHKSLTPRKLRSRTHMTMTHTASPGGPNAIRISSFSLIGAVVVKLQDVESRKFTLQKVPFLSPISGQFVCEIESDFESSVEQRGFLTMFDDVGGLGAWHRRWCALTRGVLYSWTYPDDEKHKEALCKLEINKCISERIRTVERIMCARPNTFELRTMRPRRHGDKDNLITQDTGSVITTKHWLAADTKDERIAWIDSMNQALADVRAWDVNALKPLK
uniref:anillin-like isoform X2 n=1 Tax=Ciona intestinalis TaxID=7719 RepID=UPI00089DA8E3|nr:anillin-like isoform X2 [Ciona intestinalis]|eukprot:XP_018671728.1 anillin-like isoform X2 [Ciona intestinalis]